MYTRETELRHLNPNDVYKLAIILDDDNRWKKLMEKIPKELQRSLDSSTTDYKYNNDHIRLIETAIKRPGESRLYTQILFDEWGTSGQRHERPTLGVLLQLLVQAELYRAADFVALNFLNEPPPARPLSGPAAPIDISLPDEIFDDIVDMVNDSAFYPDTESLNDNANFANSFADNNKDFYSKYQFRDKTLEPINETVVETPPPKAPPRTNRTSRLQTQQQQQSELQKMDETEATTAEVFSRSKSNQSHSHENNFRSLMTSTHNTNNTFPATERNEFNTELSEAPIPILSVLATSTTNSAASNQIQSESISVINTTGVLPVISALNLNGERDENGVDNEHGIRELRSRSNSSNSSLSNDSAEDDYRSEKIEDIENEEDDDNSVPNLSIFDQRSSNNDSSLTTVTGTSSFELSMSSSCSNENIPCLSALKQ